MGSEAIGPRRIVVGVDGSPASKAALRWAVRQARLMGGVVDAVISWEYPASYGYPLVPVDVSFEGVAGKVLSTEVAEVLQDGSEIEIRESVVVGSAAQALLDASRDAELLVVGNRGHGGFAGLLLGSVSQQCVHHATCPVVVIRDTEG